MLNVARSYALIVSRSGLAEASLVLLQLFRPVVPLALLGLGSPGRMQENVGAVAPLVHGTVQIDRAFFSGRSVADCNEEDPRPVSLREVRLRQKA